MAGDEDYALHRAAAYLLDQLEAVAVRQHQVEQQHVGRLGGEDSARILQAVRRFDDVSVQLQHFPRSRNEIGLVVYEQDLGHEYPDKDWMRSRVRLHRVRS